jgi:putative ABC transport system permease protein
MALSLKETLFVGLSDFWSRKIRAFITVFSIVLGTMSIIVVQSLVKGVQESTMQWMMERGGLTRIDVNWNWEYDNPFNLQRFLTYREFNQVRRLLPEAEYVSPQISSWRGMINYEGNQAFTHLNGVLDNYPRIEDWGVAEGRFLTNLDVTRTNDVIILGSTVKNELFGSREAIGSYVTYQDRRLQIVGVMERRFLENNLNVNVGMGSDNMLEYLNRFSFIPITTMISKLSADDRIWSFTVKAPHVDTTIELKDKVDTILLNMRRGEPVFRVTSAKETAEGMEEGAAIFGIVFMIISMISLLVGGIVIMNIMMATVHERTREIGIRMAVGARRLDIFTQFIIQTLLVTLLGGILGVILGLSVLSLVSGFIGVSMTGGLSMVILSLIIVTILGLIFGIYPAIKASNLDPVKCLAYE